MATLSSPPEDLQKILTNQKSQAEVFNPIKERGQTRSKIALIFVRWYFYLLGASLAFLTIYNFLMITANKTDQILNPKDILLIITSAIGSPLGFVVGYYFKESDKND